MRRMMQVRTTARVRTETPTSLFDRSDTPFSGWEQMDLADSYAFTTSGFRRSFDQRVAASVAVSPSRAEKRKEGVPSSSIRNESERDRASKCRTTVSHAGSSPKGFTREARIARMPSWQSTSAVFA